MALRFGVRIGRIRAEQQERFRLGWEKVFRRRIDFVPLATQPGYVAVVLPEVHGSCWAQRYAEAVKLFNGLVEA